MDIEFTRRHQSRAELALDVGEAQVRLFRRERVPVETLVFDLYGRRKGGLLQSERFALGLPNRGSGDRVAHGSSVAYRRINLRALDHQDLLSHAPPALWPLVPLTRDGQSGEALRRTRSAIRARPLPASAKADLLAILRFLAEAENVPTAIVDRYIGEMDLMNSPFFERYFKAKLKLEQPQLLKEAREQGCEQATQASILLCLELRLGKVPQTIRARVQAETRMRVLNGWQRAALASTDAPAARKLLARIRAAAPPPARAA